MPRPHSSASAHHVDSLYRTPRHNHNPIELHAVTLFWEGDNLYVHDASQAVAQTAWTLEQVFGLKEGKVHVSSPYRRRRLRQQDAVAPPRARSRRFQAREAAGAPRPFTRRRVPHRRRPHHHRAASGASAPTATAASLPDPHRRRRHDPAQQHARSSLPSPRATSTASQTFKFGQRVADMDMLANTFMRAPGEAVGTFGLESAIDELAAQMCMDPSSCACATNQKRIRPTGKPFSSARPRRRPGATAPSGSAGAKRSATPGRPAGGRVADRHGLRDRQPTRTTGCPEAGPASLFPATDASRRHRRS